MLANTTVPQGFPLTLNFGAASTLNAPATLLANTVLAADITLGNNLVLAAHLDLRAPVARANGLMPANFYPP